MLNDMMRSALALFVLVLGTVDCAAENAVQSGQAASPASPEATAAAPPGATILQTGGDTVQVSDDGSRVYGPALMLERTCDGGLRGNGPRGVVDLRKDGNAWRGIVGTAPTELYLEPIEEGGFVLRGMYGGALGRIELRPDRIEGQLGRCQYNLRSSASDLGVAYNGRKVCGSNAFLPTTLTVAPPLAAMEPIDRAAIYAILLGG